MSSDSRQFASMAFFWSAFAAETASELASATAREFVSLAIGSDAQAAKSPEPHWITPNKVALEIGAVRLRDFSTGATGPATLVCAPFALHGATIVDFALRHSLVQALQGAGIERLFVTDWRPATPQMRFWCIDDYIAALNVVVDELGGGVSLIGLCQGGWMALMYAARFPDKIHKLVLAGAPIDVAADASKLTELANNTPSAIFKELVELGEGRLQGQHLLNFWAPTFAGEEEVHRALQSPEPIELDGISTTELSFPRMVRVDLGPPGNVLPASGGAAVQGEPIGAIGVCCIGPPARSVQGALSAVPARRQRRTTSSSLSSYSPRRLSCTPAAVRSRRWLRRVGIWACSWDAIPCPRFGRISAVGCCEHLRFRPTR